jgi:2,3-dihydroxybiphenyl 1,2-dioxygenase
VITALSYIGFASPNAEAWKSFGPDVLGVELAEPGPDGAVRLRVDDRDARIVVHPGDHEQLAYLGWDVGDAAGLDAASSRVAAAGIEVEPDPGAAALRRVAAVASFTDPFGFRHELSYGLADGGPFVPGRPISGFVTGDAGLGHAVLIVPDFDAATAFYGGVLGFATSDDIEQGLKIRFLHCNPRHHTLAIANVPGMVGMHHLMLEVGSIDDVGSALDIVNARGLPLAMSLGRHTNDLMTSFYVRTPSGFEIEYGTGGRLIDDATWEVGTYDAQSLWGHKPPADGPLRPQILAPFTQRASA